MWCAHRSRSSMAMPTCRVAPVSASRSTKRACASTSARSSQHPDRQTPSRQTLREFLEIRHGEMGLIRPLAKRPLASIEEAGEHAVSLGTDAIEGVAGDKQNGFG